MKTSLNEGQNTRHSCTGLRKLTLPSSSISCLLQSSHEMEKGQEWKNTGCCFAFTHLFLARCLVGLKCQVEEIRRGSEVTHCPKVQIEDRTPQASRHWKQSYSPLIPPHEFLIAKSLIATLHTVWLSLTCISSKGFWVQSCWWAQVPLLSKNVILLFIKKRQLFPTQTLSLRYGAFFPQTV